MTHAGGESGFLTEIGLQLNQILPNGGIFLLAASGDASGYLFHIYGVQYKWTGVTVQYIRVCLAQRRRRVAGYNNCIDLSRAEAKPDHGCI